MFVLSLCDRLVNTDDLHARHSRVIGDGDRIRLNLSLGEFGLRHQLHACQDCSSNENDFQFIEGEPETQIIRSSIKREEGCAAATAHPSRSRGEIEVPASGSPFYCCPLARPFIPAHR
jgi:hypothetical protein